MNKPIVRYDAESDAAYIRFSTGKVKESEEVSEGIVLDYDEHGHIVGMEVLDARRHLPPQLLEDAA
jgi:uncharacterized protein YuzE